MNRKIFKAYLLKESLERLWTYRYEGAMLNYLHSWIDQLRWQRLPPFQKLAEMLLRSPRRDSELLPDESPAGSRRSDQRKHQVSATPRPRLQESPLSAAKGPTHGSDQDRIRRIQESRLKCAPRRILAQSPKKISPFRHSSRRRPLKLSIYPFCTGRPGRMKSNFTPA